MLRLLAYGTFIGWVVCLILWVVGTLSVWPFIGLLAATVAVNMLSGMFTVTPQQQAAANFINSLPQDARNALDNGQGILIDTRPKDERERNPINLDPGGQNE